MRTILNRALFVVLIAVVIVMGLLIANPGRDTTVETVAEDVTLKIPSADEMMGVVSPVDASPASRIHIVEKGEWLSTICLSDWKGVAELNKLENPDLIYPGQRLLLTEACETELVAQDEVEASIETMVEETFEMPTPVHAAEEKSVLDVPVLSVAPSTVVAANAAMRYDADGVIQCDVVLSNGERAFQWRQPGRNPIGNEDPEEYLDVLAKAEGLPNEVREYFLAELRKGDQGAFATERLSRCQYLGTMVGKKVNGEIRPFRHTVVNWNTELYRKKRISWGKRKQTWEEADLNDAARRYEVVVGEDRWVLLRANICGNLILRKEPLIPPQVEEPPPASVPVPIAEPPKISPPSPGTCVPQSRPRDCAMPGCVPRAPLSDATPACAASPESALKQNSNPARERRIPEGYGEQGSPIVPIIVGAQDEQHPGIPQGNADHPRLLAFFAPNGEDPILSCTDFDRLMIGTHACP